MPAVLSRFGDFYFNLFGDCYVNQLAIAMPGECGVMDTCRAMLMSRHDRELLAPWVFGGVITAIYLFPRSPAGVVVV